MTRPGRRPVLILLLPLLGLLPVAAGSQEEEPATDAEARPDPDAPRAEETVTVEGELPFLPTSNTIATKLPVPLVWTPALVGAVDAALLREQGAQVLGDALRHVAGVNVQTGSGVFDYFVLRGFDSLNGALVLTDGAPEPEVTFYHLYDADRVEVLKGPAGFLYGSNPLGGAVNIVRRQPTAADLGSLRLGGGSFGTRQGALDWNQAGEDGSTAFRVNGFWRESDGFRDGRESEVTAVRPSFTWRNERLGTLNVNVEALSSDYTPDAGLPLLGGELPAVPRERSYASPLDFSEQDIVRAQLDWERPFADRFRLRNKLYLRQLDWTTDGTLLSGVLPVGPLPTDLLVLRTLTRLEDDQSFLGNQLEAVAELGSGRARHELLVGLELGRYSDEFSLDVGLLDPISLFAPVETTSGPPPPLPGQSSRGDSDTDVVAPYVVDQIRVGDRWAFTLGARLDRIDFSDSVTGTERDDTEVSPLVGAVYSPRAGLWLYASTARSFAPASPRVAGPRDPEESRQVEIGLRKDLRSDLRLSAAAYRLERENIAIPDDNGFTQQAGDQESVGLELELAGRLTHTVDAAISYAWTDAELTRFAEQIQFPPFPVIDRSGNRPAFAPEHLASAWLSRGFGDRFRLGGGLRWVGDQFIAEDNEAEIDGHALLDASLGWTAERWSATLHLRNLTDAEYETRGFGSFSVIPGDPVAAQLEVEYRW